jgi:hypothetical protein
MRILFATVALLGLLLAGLSAFEVRQAKEYGFLASELHAAVVEIDRQQVATEIKEHRYHFITQGGPTLEQEAAWLSDGMERLEGEWLAAGGAGLVLLLVGVRGLAIIGKITKLPPPKKLGV